MDPRNSETEEGDLTQQQEEPYAELARVVYEHLLKGIR